MKKRPLVIIVSAVLLYTGAGFTASCHGQNQTVSDDAVDSGVVSHTPTEPPP